MGRDNTKPSPMNDENAEAGDAASSLSIWRRVRARLKQEYGDVVYMNHIARLRVATDAAGRICVVCPTEFGRAWAEDNLGSRLRALWAMYDGSARDILIATESQVLDREPARVDLAEVDRSSPSTGRTRAPLNESASTAALSAQEPERKEARFTFDTFMVGSANIMAATAAKAVAGAHAPPFNPAFFHGGYGVGKTHLLSAIAHAVTLGESARKALYLTAEEFLNGFQSALRARDTRPFKELVRDCDVLIVDDVHFITGKTRTEDEFLQTINALIAAEKQVVLASHCPPAELEASDPRLRDIIAGGFHCPMDAPDLDLRRKILDCKIAQALSHCPNLEVPETVRDFLAARVTSSARELEGVLNNIIVRTGYLGRSVTMETVEAALGELPFKPSKRITVDEIQKAVADYFGLSVDDLLSKRRTQTVVRPRHVAMYLAKIMTTRSLPDIGRRFGGRDHSTVIHAVRKMTALLASDAVLAEDVEAVKRRLRG